MVRKVGRDREGDTNGDASEVKFANCEKWLQKKCHSKPSLMFDLNKR